LLRLANELVFCFDGDAAGRKAAWRALEVSLPLTQDHKPLRFLFLPDGDDPDTFVRSHGKEAFEKRVQEAPGLSEFLVAELRSQMNLATAEGRSQFLVAAKPHLQKIAAASLRLQMVKEVARLAEVTQEEAERLVGIASEPGYRRPAPAKRQFKAPESTEWNLLARIATFPSLASHIDIGLVDPSREESQALKDIPITSSAARAEGLSPAMMIEHFKESSPPTCCFRRRYSACSCGRPRRSRGPS
jgi:DNA primase